jgi:hypothetical protein
MSPGGWQAPLLDLASKCVCRSYPDTYELISVLDRQSHNGNHDMSPTFAVVIVRTARAEGRAKIIRAETDAEAAAIEQRAKFRLQYEAVREQQNLEEAVKGSLPLLTENGNPDKLDDDWLARWTSEAKMVSDPAIRTIWSKIRP